MPRPKYYVAATLIVFTVIFNVGYVFHEILAAPAFARWEAEIVRPAYIIPLIALAFLAYAALFSHFFAAYRVAHPNGSVYAVGLRFGILMGVVFDALQGGLIEVATFRMPIEVFYLDSGYHVFVEGSIAGLLAAFAHRRWSR